MQFYMSYMRNTAPWSFYTWHSKCFLYMISFVLMYLCQINQESMLLYYSKYTYVEPLSNGLACLDLYKTYYFLLSFQTYLFSSHTPSPDLHHHYHPKVCYTRCERLHKWMNTTFNFQELSDIKTIFCNLFKMR